MPELELTGCTPEPLMGYLKALGAFRLIAEQADADATISWANDTCRLHTVLDRGAMADYFLNRYRPTPILAPWNSSGGFYSGGTAPLAAIASSSCARLSLYRDTISAVRELLPNKPPKDDEKERLLIHCRAALPDAVVPWLDSCFALGENGPSYFPLLGTGGTDGRLEFTNNFFQRLADVIAFAADAPPPAAAAGWLASALFADDPKMSGLEKAAVGQFNPGGAGGANGVQGKFEAGSRINPWDFVLMIEGAILFAGSVARRLGANAGGRVVFPFSVKSIAVGYGSATYSEETTDSSRAELWLPLWDHPARLSELRQLFAEGRAQVGRRQARNAIEFALAVCLLGVSRGIRAFTRYGFLKRNGLAFLATPLGRVSVTPHPDARLLDDPPLADWLDRVRLACRDKDKTPARYQAALRNIDRAMYEFATRAQTDPTADRRALLEVLRAVGRAERTLATGLAFCTDKRIRPLQGLSPQWLDQANDGSAEFQLAAAVAGVRGVRDTGVGPFRVHLEPVTIGRGGWFEWDAGSMSAVWSNRSLDENLAAAFRRRQLEAFRAGVSGVPMYSPRPAPLTDVVAFLEEAIEDEKLHDLIWGLSAVEWSGVAFQLPEPSSGADVEVPFEFGVPRLLVVPLTLVVSGGGWQLGDSGEPTTPDADVFHALASTDSDAVGRCIDRAARRLKAGGRLVVGYRNRRQAGKSLAVVSAGRPSRLLAACLFPLPNAALEMIANAVLYPPETQE